MVCCNQECLEDLRDVIKELINKVKNVIIAFHAKMSEIIAIVKILMITIWNNSQVATSK